MDQVSAKVKSVVKILRQDLFIHLVIRSVMQQMLIKFLLCARDFSHSRDLRSRGEINLVSWQRHSNQIKWRRQVT